MGWMQLVSNLAWPVVAIFAILVFYSPLREKLSELSKFTISKAGASAKFAKKAKKDSSASVTLLKRKLRRNRRRAYITLPFGKNPERASKVPGKEIEATVAPMSELELENLGKPVEGNEGVWSDLFDLAEFDGRDAVKQAYRVVQESLKQVKGTGGEELTEEQAIALLRNKGWIPGTFTSSIAEISLLGRQAERSERFDITKAGARNYLEASRTVTSLLDQLFRVKS